MANDTDGASNHDTATPLGVVWRLKEAIDAHDLDAMVDCFAPDFHSDHPTTPDHEVDSDDNVRVNWTRIFERVPDVRMNIGRHVVDGQTVWAEVEHPGTQTDGRPFLLRGVIVFEIADGRMVHNTLYMTPVRAGGPDVLGDEVRR